ncbi:catalytic protein [Saccharata proteae CBS 121410]|uniref:Catalytic protein n=1 Tax=Saccharata proteae CBS 121410 TaxID=1314787 RepID=A0A9P4LTK0_9PEZI|nr:catalytic protein [Saccharata proteae CBS 121410]
MRSFIVAASSFAVGIQAAALPLLGLNIPILNNGFTSPPTITTSAGGNAQCWSGNIAITATTNSNTHLNYASPANQSVVTETFVEYLQPTSGQTATITGPDTTVSGTYNINSKICFPLVSLPPLLSPSTIQFLIHGIGFDKSYWDFAPGYSYVDAAALAGYATFSYDRLGVGLSDHPDPIQVVQAPLQVEIAHQLIQTLRSGAIMSTTFSHVVVAGHSFGSIQTVGLANKYPRDADALILQGFSLNSAALGLTFADFTSTIASQASPSRFGSLPNGYLVTGSAAANQFAFFRGQNFDPKIFSADETSKQTFSLGELFTLAKVVAPAPSFSGPVDTVLGQNDFIFCSGDCAAQGDLSRAVQPALFSNAGGRAGSESFLVPGAGHAVNLHYSAPQAFAHMISFVRANGF